MKLAAKDLAAMKLPLLLLAVAAAASFLLVEFSSDRREKAETQVRIESTALQDARSRYQRSGEERETILRYLPAYRQLENQGFVGIEQRINWLEGLRIANTKAGLFGVTYQLDPQKPFAVIGQSNPMSQHLRNSQMKLSFGLVHEGDLMRFFQTLAEQQTGVFILTGCALDRVGRSEPEPRQANLSAQCDLSWVTVDPGKGKS
ncbi:MAG: hypothetical protein ACT4PQ_07935 [Betaproteobacteria bacterium]